MGVVETGAGVAIGLKITERKNLILAYKVLSKPQKKVYSKGIIAVVSILLILGYLVPIILLCCIPQLFTLEELGGQVGVGIILGCFVSYLLIYPTIARIITKHITMTYHILTKERYRWGMGVVFSDEVDRYHIYSKGNGIYILLDKNTGNIINSEVKPPYETRGKRAFWIVVSLICMIFCDLLFLASSPDNVWIGLACFLVSIVAFVLSIFRTIKQEY